MPSSRTCAPQDELTASGVYLDDKRRKYRVALPGSPVRARPAGSAWKRDPDDSSGVTLAPVDEKMLLDKLMVRYLARPLSPTIRRTR